MKRYGIGIGTLLALAASTALAVAPPSGPRKDALATADARLGELAGQTKGAPQHLLLMQQQKIRQLIEDLDAGKHVGLSEIDRALGDAERGF
jgi:hypothetical protein